ncbi:MAG: FAD:protein FMN transferase [Planctomycetes bacterium]|nr:FAD:protein FMN transferase [Planctomycetota bacterium]
MSRTGRPRSGWTEALALGIAVIVALGSCGNDATKQPFLAAGATMGTTYAIKVATLPADLSEEQLAEGVQVQVDRVDALMSTYREDSELSRFNRLGKNEWFAVSAETACVLAEAARVSRLTGGAFDVTVGPLVKLWSFGPGEKERRVPSDDQLALLGERVGQGLIELDESGRRLRKLADSVEIDLSAIAKGFAVDEVAKWLESRGVSSYLIEIGGEMRAKGRKTDETPWRVGIEAPTDDRRTVHMQLTIESRSLATSGDYRNFFESNGRRYSHIIDPRTSRPVAHRLASVSVVAETCMHADAMATALSVLGPDQGLALAEELRLAVLFMVRTDQGFDELKTKAFERLSLHDR